MSGPVVAVIVGLLVLYAAFCVWGYRWQRRRPLERDRIIAAARARAGLDVPEWEYDGPDSLRLLEGLEAHMKAYGETVADFYEPVGPPPGPDPMAAVRDNQNDSRGNQ